MSQKDITELLHDINRGDDKAWEPLLQQTYAHLLELVSASQEHIPLDKYPTLDTYAILHEAYWNIYHSKQIEWNDRQHFFLTMARAFHFAFSAYHRNQNSKKRKRPAKFVDLEELESLSPPEREAVLLALDDALKMLEEIHPRAYNGVTLRFFTGFKEKEIAEIQGVTTRTVIRDWILARATLSKIISQNL